MPFGRLPENTLSGGCRVAGCPLGVARQPPENGVARGNVPRAPDFDMALVTVFIIDFIGNKVVRITESAWHPT